MKTIVKLLLIATVLSVLACAYNKPSEINLMPAPDIYLQSNIDPFPDENPMEVSPYSGILYATDRMPLDMTKNQRVELLRDN